MKYIGNSVGTFAALIFVSDVLAHASPSWEITTEGSVGRLSSEVIRIPSNANRRRIIEDSTRVRTHPLISTRRPPVIIVDSIRANQKPLGAPSK